MAKRNNKENVGKVIRGLFKILDYKRENGRSYYFVECQMCKAKKWMRCDSVMNENVVSCGCYNKENNYISNIDIKGMRSGRLVAVKDIGATKGKDHIWECKCDCGNTHYVEAYLIKGKKVRSCGCLHDESRLENLEKAIESCKSFIKDGTNYKIINKTGPIKSNKSTGERCITYDQQRNKYAVRMGYKGVKYFFGRYNRLEDAIRIRDIAFEARKNDALVNLKENL